MKLKKYLPLILLLLCLSGCKTPQISYLDNLRNDQLFEKVDLHAMVLQTDDQLTIFVKSIDPSITAMFNLVSGTTGGSYDQANNQRTYTVDQNGDIQMPVLGTVHVLGMNREQVAAAVKHEIESRSLAKDVTVIVDFKGLYYFIGGEVGQPGRKEIVKDKTNILDALTEAGDITINGRRDNILLIRHEGDMMRSYRINLTSSDSLVSSPAFAIKEGDYVYVSPTDKRKRESTAAGNSFSNPSFWISVTSVLMTVASIVISATR